MHNNEKSSEDLLKKVRELQEENKELHGVIEKLSDEELIKLHKAVESSYEAIFMTDLKGIMNYINPAFTKLYGYTHEEVIGKVTPRILKSGQMNQEEYKYFWTTLLNKDVVQGELINRTKDGRLLTIEGSVSSILDEKKNIIGFIGIQHDITLRKQAEKAQKLSEELLRKAFITSPDSVNINRLSDGMFVSVNGGFTKILGYSEEDVIGKSSIELNIWAAREDRNRIVTELQKKGRVESFEAQFRHKNGTVVYGLMSASIIELDGVPHILNITKDITERKKIEDAFRSERFLTNALMDNLTDHIFFKDLNSKFIRNNKAHVLSFGLENPAELIGKSDFDFFSKEAAQRAFEDEKTIIKTGKSISKEEKLTRKNQSDVWFSVVKMPLNDAYGNIVGTFGISRDITKQKYAEETLKQSEARFRSVAQSANDAIITVDNRGNIQG